MPEIPEECRAQVQQARAETRASFENRALMYWYIYQELSAEVGDDRAAEVMKRAIRRRGEEIGERYREAAQAGDLEEVARIFCAESACEGELFTPGVEEQAEEHVVLRMDTCPLVDAWRKAGLSDEEVDRMCEIASAVDYGTFEGAGLELTFRERQAEPGGKCCLLELRVPKQS